MPHYQIKCRFTGGVRFEGEFGSLRLCVEAGVRASANLAGADLARANLAGADLARANLASADLRGTKLGKRGLLKDASRSDGYRFMLFDCEDGAPRVLRTLAVLW